MVLICMLAHSWCEYCAFAGVDDDDDDDGDK